MRTSTREGRPRPPPHYRAHSVGNTPAHGHQLPAFQVPIPWEDFEAHTNSPVCRAASGSIQQGTPFQGAGERTPFHRKDHMAFQAGDQVTNGEGDITSCYQAQASHKYRMHDFDHSTTPASPVDGLSSGAPGEQVIVIKGGANNFQDENVTTKGQPRMHNTYASTTECILQNLSMTVGNPSSRCFANAP